MNKLKLIMFGLALVTVMYSPGTSAATVNPTTTTTRLPYIRMYNLAINDHFYTTSQFEANVAQSNYGYRIEGIIGYVEQFQLNGTKGIIRMWNPKAKKHFYTTDANEALAAQRAGFVNEGTAGYIQVDTAPVTGDMAAPTEIPKSKFLYRMYNNSLSKHFYTVDQTEMTGLLSRGFRLEGNLGTLYSALYASTVCPDEWIINEMPGVVGETNPVPREYFIVNGQRVELTAYDVNWVIANCDVTRKSVY